ncbi:MAG: hypothetical protein A2Z64_10005 [Betaproteobacteria bacterium RIFCSPLOWO2_02_67_12]|nr:MAG: hypothetical protein A2Z64_10005 [Betaproteobacteria bacterium RIFCSPLOWO2_02_67_12]OGA26577.1 MAG: hypothetical protein A3I65_02145 [Betaproteobacteria bacterium RIFCSPLOWO2_02_FULL_68_150]OGA67275.1 MAG: hypothetical protein A3F77_06685 [Betaproteobacteria bacterium RIFCSPLOWO2_12_FULL_67_28]
MATRPDERMTEPVMDATDLWLEEVYTDRKIGTIRKLTPVRGDGARDPAREVQWVGETQVMSQIGTLPITFALEAKTLAEAALQFGPEAKKAIERTVRELQDLRRQAASSIVIPQGGMPPMGPGGLPGGGKIQMP